MNNFFIEIVNIIFPLVLGSGIFAVFLISLNVKIKTIFSDSLLLLLIIPFLLVSWDSYLSNVINKPELMLPWPFKNFMWLVGPALYAFIKNKFYPQISPMFYCWHLIPFILFNVIVLINPIDSNIELKVAIAAWHLISFVYIALSAKTLLDVNIFRLMHYSKGLSAIYRLSIYLLIGFALLAIVDFIYWLPIILGDKTFSGNTPPILLIRTVYTAFLIVVLHKVDANNVLDTFELANKTAKEKKKPVELRLSQESGKEISKLLENEVINHKLYLDSDIRLSTLATRLGISTHYLSETLNKHMGVSFYTYINTHRVKLAEKLLHTTDRPIVDIAIECGFNSKTSFYNTFKSLYGMTPAAHRKSARLLN